MCLIDFATATLDEITAEVERMLHERRVRYYPSTLLTPVESAERTTSGCTDAGLAGTSIKEIA